MLMIRPPSPWPTICRAAAWAPKKVHLRFVSRTASQLASSTSNTPWGMFSPALLIMTSSRPSSEATGSTARLDAGNVGDVHDYRHGPHPLGDSIRGLPVTAP